MNTLSAKGKLIFCKNGHVLIHAWPGNTTKVIMVNNDEATRSIRQDLFNAIWYGYAETHHLCLERPTDEKHSLVGFPTNWQWYFDPNYKMINVVVSSERWVFELDLNLQQSLAVAIIDYIFAPRCKYCITS